MIYLPKEYPKGVVRKSNEWQKCTAALETGRMDEKPGRREDRAVAKKLDKITIEKEKLRPKERAPIMPTRHIEDKRARNERREKHKKDLRRLPEEP